MADIHETLKNFYLQAVEDGDAEAVGYALQNRQLFDVNGRDYKGRSALILAINGDSHEILRTLLRHGVSISDAFLYAIDEGKYEAVKVFCQFALSLKQSKSIDLLNTGSDNEEPCITPLVKAGQCNDYHITKLLLQYGAVMPDPERLISETSLEMSLSKLHIYQAVASESYISLTSEDPIGHAFQLSVRLRHLSLEEYEFKQEYTELSNKCEQFAADLLSQTRDKAEITAILTHDSSKHESRKHHQGVYRAMEAVFLYQKKFIAHAHCQQFLIGEWYKELKNKIDKNQIVLGLTSLLIAISYPILSILYMIFPKGKLAKFLRIPFVKFVMHAASYLTFLILLLMTPTHVKFSVGYCTSEFTQRNDIIRCLKQGALIQQERGPPPTIIEWFIVVWIVGFTWREIKELWKSGVSAYLRDAYNLMDWCQLCLYWCVIGVRIVAYLQIHVLEMSNSQTTQPPPLSKRDVSGQNSSALYQDEQLNQLARMIIENLTAAIVSGNDNTEDAVNRLSDMVTGLLGSGGGTTAQPSAGNVDDSSFDDDWWADDSWYDAYESDDAFNTMRTSWDEWDPTLLADCIFAVANIISVLRILRLVVIDRHVGPMQISMTKMIVDIMKFFFIFGWIWVAFSLGITQVYWAYNAQDVLDCYSQPNTTNCNSAPFSSVSASMNTLLWSMFDLMSLDNLDTTANHSSTEGFGAFIYAMYMIIGFTVLLNLLIAVMSNTYTKIEENSDMEWKFYRAEIWVSYFENGATLPVPFNIIPTPKSLFYLLKHVVCCYACRSPPTRKSFRQSISKKRARNRQYQAVVSRLVHRHFASKSADQDDDNVPAKVSDFKEFKEETINYRNEIFRLTENLMERMQGIERALIQSASSGNNVALQEALLAVNADVGRRSSKNIKWKMVEEVHRYHSIMQRAVAETDALGNPVAAPSVPVFNKESRRGFRQRREADARDRGPYGHRNGVANPAFEGEYVPMRRSDIPMTTAMPRR